MKNLTPDHKNTLLLIIDVQEKLFNAMPDKDELLDNLLKIVKAFNILEIPLIFFEQNPKGLGSTIETLKSEIKNAPVFEKKTFSACYNTEFMNVLKQLHTKNIILCGIESHVCVFQTGRDLIEKGYNIHILQDGVSSRKELDKETGIKRLELMGGIPTTIETTIFDLLQTCGRQEFKPILKLVK